MGVVLIRMDATGGSGSALRCLEQRNVGGDSLEFVVSDDFVVAGPVLSGVDCEVVDGVALRNFLFTLTATNFLTWDGWEADEVDVGRGEGDGTGDGAPTAASAGGGAVDGANAELVVCAGGSFAG